jgi:hypothetical protein
VKSYNQALSWNPTYEPAQDALRKLGIRKAPVVPILPRNHPVNVLLGKALHRKVKRPLPA